jgi:hypothetical protein
MYLRTKQKKIIRWTARGVALFSLLFGLPFYFGYGNPLPFVNPEYTVFDNIWLSAFPIMFFGLALGWKWEKLGGYLIVVPLTIASVIGFVVLKESLPGPMFVPMIVGIVYLVVGYSSDKKPNA